MALNSKRRILALTGVLAVALTATACGSSDDDGGSDTASSGTSSIDCAPYKAFGDLTGKTVTVYTSIIAPEDAPAPGVVQAVRGLHRRHDQVRGLQGVRGPAAGARQGWQRP